MIKSCVPANRSSTRGLLWINNPVGKLVHRVPRTHLQLTFVAILATFVILVYFWPIFKGYTFSDVATRRKAVVPWCYSTSDQTAAIHYDQADTFYPWQVFINRALRSGEVPLWNPLSFGGHPFFANGSSTIFYPPKTLLSSVLSAARVHDALVLSHMLAGCLTMFLLLNRSRVCFAASFFGGIAWMLNSFMLSWMALEHFVVIEAWLPLAVLLLGRVAEGHLRAAVLLGVVLSLMYAGANPLFGEMTFIALASYALYLLARRWQRVVRKDTGFSVSEALRVTGFMAIAALLCAGLIAVQLLPTLELVRSMDRAALDLTGLAGSKLPVSELSCFFLGPSHTVTTPLGDAEDPYHRMMFMGTATALLALAGFLRKHPLGSYSRVLAVSVLMIVLGTPVMWVAMKLIPGFGHLKPLGRLLFLFDFAAVILAALGLDWLLRALPELVKWRMGQVGRVTWRLGVSLALVFIVAVQMYSVASWVVRYQPDDGDRLYPETPLIKTLGNDNSSRMLALYPSFVGSTAMAFGLNNAGGYDSLVPLRTSRLWRVVQGASPDSVIDNAPMGALATAFQRETRFDMLGRLSVTRMVTPLLFSVIGCTGEGGPAIRIPQLSAVAERPVVSGDWDGDGIDTIGLYDSEKREFLLWRSNAPHSDFATLPLAGAERDWIPVAGDWNGDGTDEPGLYDSKDGVFHLYLLSGNHWDLRFKEPGSNWIPLAGDWDGNGQDTPGLFDLEQGNLHLENSLKPKPGSSVSVTVSPTGEHGYPVVGDWNGDRVDTIGFYEPSAGAFRGRNSNAGEPLFDIAVQWGPKGKDLIPLAGCWSKEANRPRMDVLGLCDPSEGSVYLCRPRSFGRTDLTCSYSASDGEIYTVENPLPRAYVVYAAEVVADGNAALRRFADPAFDASRNVLIESDCLAVADIRSNNPTEFASSPQAQAAEVVTGSLNKLSVNVHAEHDGWLVVTECWDQGWRATLDGKLVPIFYGNYAFRAVRVPVGEHSVSMVYEPDSYVAGKWISGSTITFLLFGVAALRFRRRGKIIQEVRKE